jgi:hypothetical protein
VHVHVARAAEVAVLEVMVLEVGDGVRHVVVAGEPGVAPQRLAVAREAGAARHAGRQLAQQQLGAVGALTQLGMRQVEIVLALHHVVRIFVAEREADPVYRGVVADQVQADHLDLVAAVERVGRQLERLLGRHHTAPIALVEPFGLHADLAGRRLAALQTPLEHLHRIGELRLVGLQLGVHRVARRRAAQVRQAGARDQPARGVGVVQRRQQAAVAHDRGVAHRFLGAPVVRHRLHGGAAADRFHCDVVDGAGAADNAQTGAVVRHDAYAASAAVVQELH